jgi:hypothetical protein
MYDLPMFTDVQTQHTNSSDIENCVSMMSHSILVLASSGGARIGRRSGIILTLAEMHMSTPTAAVTKFISSIFCYNYQVTYTASPYVVI